MDEPQLVRTTTEPLRRDKGGELPVLVRLGHGADHAVQHHGDVRRTAWRRVQAAAHARGDDLCVRLHIPKLLTPVNPRRGSRVTPYAEIAHTSADEVRVAIRRGREQSLAEEAALSRENLVLLTAGRRKGESAPEVRPENFPRPPRRPGTKNRSTVYVPWQPRADG